MGPVVRKSSGSAKNAKMRRFCWQECEVKMDFEEMPSKLLIRKISKIEIMQDVGSAEVLGCRNAEVQENKVKACRIVACSAQP